MISVVNQKSMVVKTKQISWFRWLVKKVWLLKQNRFRDFGGWSKKYLGLSEADFVISVVGQKSMENQTDFVISVVSQKTMVVKTKQISWFR